MRPLSLVKFKQIRPSQVLWEEFFGPYPWFFTPTIGEIVSESGARLSDIYFAYRDFFAHLVPPEWHRRHSWGQWDVISQVQFRTALSQDLVRLDKAILTIASVTAFTIDGGVGARANNNERYISNNNIGHIVLPSTFVIDGFEKVIRDEKAISFIIDLTGQRRIVLEEVARGYAVVEYIADSIISASRLFGDYKLDMRLIKDRRDGIRGKLVRPVSSQTLDHDKIADYYEMDHISTAY